jgi:glyceraldehyde-3-phosphate dehydrogenase (NADP+)
MKTFCKDTFYPSEEDIPEELISEIPVVLDKYLVGGALKDWEGPFREVRSPVCVRGPSGPSRMVIGRYPLLTERESLEALRAARDAFDAGRGLWPAMTPARRIECMETFVSGMASLKDRITRLLMWEIGKTYKDAGLEFDRTVNYTRGVIAVLGDESKRPPQTVMEQGIVGRIGRAPLGVVLCMGPFNYPLFETFTGLVPALLGGNSVIFKPPRFGTLLYQPLLEVFRDSFPAGAVNEVSGEGRQIIPALLSSGMIDALAFIGTSSVATYLRGLHPKPHRLRCALGLEAKNPALVLPDADMDTTIRECVAGALSFNGQRCAALKIFFVPRSIAAVFLERFREALDLVKPGMPWEESVLVTPLVEPGKSGYLAELVADAVRLGARVVNDGGGETCGSFFSPALLYPVTPAMRVYGEEQFGPLIPVAPYDDVEEALQYIAESNFGQQASIFGKDKDVVASLAGRLLHQVSRVNINCQCQRSPDMAPFTGRKDSAEGSLSISDAPTAFTVPSLISARDTEANREIIKAVKAGKEE